MPGNQLYFGAVDHPVTLTGPLTGEINRYFRVKVFEP